MGCSNDVSHEFLVRSNKFHALGLRHCIKVIRAHNEWIRSVCPSLDGRLLLTASNDQVSYVFAGYIGVLIALGEPDRAHN